MHCSLGISAVIDITCSYREVSRPNRTYAQSRFWSWSLQFHVGRSLDLETKLGLNDRILVSFSSTVSIIRSQCRCRSHHKTFRFGLQVRKLISRFNMETKLYVCFRIVASTSKICCRLTSSVPVNRYYSCDYTRWNT